MAIVIVTEKISEAERALSREEHGDYIKVVVDIEKEILAAGGEWHADAEKLLLERGSKQEHLWGGGVDSNDNRIEFVALINMRPRYSRSQEVLDVEIRNKMEEIIRRIFEI